MLPVLFPEQFHFPTQAWGGGPGAKWPAERISVWNSRAPQRKPGRRSGHSEAEEARGDDKDRARRYDSSCVCVCVSVQVCVCVCMYGHRNTLPSSPLSVLDLSTFSCFFNSFSRLLTVCLFSPVSLSVSNTHAGTLKAGNTDVTVFPVCSELLPTWQRLCGSAPQHKCGLRPRQGKLFDYKTYSADLMPGTLPPFYFATQEHFSPCTVIHQRLLTTNNPSPSQGFYLFRVHN